jgi:hypothetical protein
MTSSATQALVDWSCGRDSNPHQRALQARLLPFRLPQQEWIRAGFEPATLDYKLRRSSLSYLRSEFRAVTMPPTRGRRRHGKPFFPYSLSTRPTSNSDRLETICQEYGMSWL